MIEHRRGQLACLDAGICSDFSMTCSKDLKGAYISGGNVDISVWMFWLSSLPHCSSCHQNASSIFCKSSSLTQLLIPSTHLLHVIQPMLHLRNLSLYVLSARRLGPNKFCESTTNDVWWMDGYFSFVNLGSVVGLSYSDRTDPHWFYHNPPCEFPERYHYIFDGWDTHAPHSSSCSPKEPSSLLS